MEMKLCDHLLDGLFDIQFGLARLRAEVSTARRRVETPELEIAGMLLEKASEGAAGIEREIRMLRALGEANRDATR